MTAWPARRCPREVGALSGKTVNQPGSWWVVAGDDKMILPPARRLMSQPARSSVVEVAGSHAIYVSKSLGRGISYSRRPRCTLVRCGHNPRRRLDSRVGREFRATPGRRAHGDLSQVSVLPAALVRHTRPRVQAAWADPYLASFGAPRKYLELALRVRLSCQVRVRAVLSPVRRCHAVDSLHSILQIAERKH